MKYKVGDKVRVRKDLKEGKHYGSQAFGFGMGEYKGKKAIIKCIIGDGYKLNLDDEFYGWSDEMLEPVNKTVQNTKKSTVKSGQFTKEDFEFGDIVILRNGDILIFTGIAIMRNSADMIFPLCDYDDTSFKYNHADDFDIMKVERYIKNRNGSYNLTTLYERKEEILDDKEKEYLSKVIEPFKNRKITISKIEKFDKKEEFILIEFREDEYLQFPYFKSNTMYKNMEINKRYTLEELGL